MFIQEKLETSDMQGFGRDQLLPSQVCVPLAQIAQLHAEPPQFPQGTANSAREPVRQLSMYVAAANFAFITPDLDQLNLSESRQRRCLRSHLALGCSLGTMSVTKMVQTETPHKANSPAAALIILTPC